MKKYVPEKNEKELEDFFFYFLCLMFIFHAFCRRSKRCHQGLSCPKTTVLGNFLNFKINWP